MAEAIRVALEMQSEERKTRMQRMRKVVREHNIYRWAGNLIAQLCEVRLDEAANRSQPVRPQPEQLTETVQFDPPNDYQDLDQTRSVPRTGDQVDALLERGRSVSQGS